jgi:hypothetical protein
VFNRHQRVFFAARGWQVLCHLAELLTSRNHGGDCAMMLCDAGMCLYEDEIGVDVLVRVSLDTIEAGMIYDMYVCCCMMHGDWLLLCLFIFILVCRATGGTSAAMLH